MSSAKRRTASTDKDAPKRKRVKRQIKYHSSSSESELEFPTDEVDHEVDKDDVEEIAEESNEEPSQNDEEESDIDSDESEDEVGQGKQKKRNDPNAFATSISKILNSKLTTSKRVDPVLSRSKDASKAAKEMSEAKLESKAKQKMRDEKRVKLETGRIKDILGLNNTEVSTEEIIEHEKKYKKTAQRGVVRMFNAIRAAQVMGEQAARDAQRQGVVGIDKREQKVNEMSKKGFLELIAGGGKK
jgi:fusion and transport protein UGO1